MRLSGYVLKRLPLISRKLSVRNAFLFVNAFNPKQQLIRINWLIHTGVNMVADGVFKLGMKAILGGAQKTETWVFKRQIANFTVFYRNRIDIENNRKVVA